MTKRIVKIKRRVNLIFAGAAVAVGLLVLISQYM